MKLTQKSNLVQTLLVVIFAGCKGGLQDSKLRLLSLQTLHFTLHDSSVAMRECFFYITSQCRRLHMLQSCMHVYIHR
jgi:hypothetical protein